MITRTGYTGEDGVEMVLPKGVVKKIWDSLVGAGVTPCGLGARDTLRLEAGLCLYGNDIDLTTNPIEAGLAQFVQLQKDDFIGKKALDKVAREGTKRKLVGFVMRERSPAARHGFNIIYQGREVGQVTSGSYAPTLERNIGMGYVPTALGDPGMALDVDIRGRREEIQVSKLPFYRRQRKSESPL